MLEPDLEVLGIRGYASDQCRRQTEQRGDHRGRLNAEDALIIAKVDVG
jgi:hypothetical protein